MSSLEEYDYKGTYLLAITAHNSSPSRFNVWVAWWGATPIGPVSGAYYNTRERFRLSEGAIDNTRKVADSVSAGTDQTCLWLREEGPLALKELLANRTPPRED